MRYKLGYKITYNFKDSKGKIVFLIIDFKKKFVNLIPT